MNVDEKLFSIRDFAECAARQANTWTAGSLAMALENLAGKEAAELMLEVEIEVFNKWEETRPAPVEVIKLLTPNKSEEDIVRWMTTKTPLELAVFRNTLIYRNAEKSLWSKP